jgi:hypothetical protein
MLDMVYRRAACGYLYYQSCRGSQYSEDTVREAGIK